MAPRWCALENIMCRLRAAHMSSKPCGGLDRWRRTEGCHDPHLAARVPKDDLDCSETPGIQTAGYCDCKDQIPRFAKCGVPKQKCQLVCSRPPPPSTLPAAFAAAPAATKEKRAPPQSSAEHPYAAWARRHAPVVVVCGVVLFMVVVSYLTAPATDERKRVLRMLQVEKRRVQFENSLYNTR